MNNGSEHGLSRRKVLGGLVTIGAAGAAAGAGTMALFSDTESSTGNTIQAGTLDLQPDGSAVRSFSVTNAAPGDSGAQTIDLSNAGSIDGYLAFTVNQVTNNENGTPDSEVNSSLDDGSSPGELGKWLILRMGYAADGSSGLDPSEVMVEGYLTASSSPFPNTGGMEHVRFNQNTLLPANNGQKDFVIEWEIDSDAGNEIQDDGVEFDLEFELMQQEAHRDVVLDGDTAYAQGKGWDGFNTTSAEAHVGDGSWQAKAGDNQEGLWFGADYSDIDTLQTPIFNEIEELSYWMKHNDPLDSNDFYLQIFTKPRGNPSDTLADNGTWYNAKYTAVPPNANNLNWTPGDWNKFTTASGSDNQLIFYLEDKQHNQVDSLPLKSLSGLKTDPWQVTVSGTSYDYPNPSSDDILGFAILTNSADDNFEGYLDDLYLRTANRELSVDLEP